MTTVDENNNPSAASIEVSEFEARFAETMQKVAVDGEELIITANGTPISRISKIGPLSESPAQSMVFGQHCDHIHILGDIVSPMPVDWYAKGGDDEDLY